MVIVNIGLHGPGGSKLSYRDALVALVGEGVHVVRYAIMQSASEPTLVAELDRPLTDNQAYWVSAVLQQEAIAQQTKDGEGRLHGPMAEEWGPFNPDFFLTFLEE